MEKIVCPKCKSDMVVDLGVAAKDNSAISKIIGAINWGLSGGKSEHNFQCAKCQHKFKAAK